MSRHFSKLILGAILVACSIWQAASGAAPSSLDSEPTFRRISAGRSSTRPASDEVSAVIPSPNDDHFASTDDGAAFESSNNAHIDDIIRKLAPPAAISERSSKHSVSGASRNARPQFGAVNQAVGSDSKAVPVYVSPFVRPQSGAGSDSEAEVHGSGSTSLVGAASASAASPISAHSSAPMSDSKMNSYASPSHDLKTSASYGHHGYEHGHKGWLDMGAYTGGKGSFGWYADYPVGGKKHHYGYHGRR